MGRRGRKPPDGCLRLPGRRRPGNKQCQPGDRPTYGRPTPTGASPRQLALIQDDAAFVEGRRGDPRALLHEARHELGADIVRANLYMPRLKRSMRLAARHGRMPRGRSIFLTEYGIQSRPPDPFGASPRQQARWLNESERLVWSDRRVGGLSAS